MGRGVGVAVLGGAGILAVAASLVALLLAGGAPAPALTGLPDAGPATAWAVRGARLLTDVAAILTVGSLLVGAVLTSGPRPSTPPARWAVAAGRWAAVWAVAAVTLLLLTVADAAGTPAWELSPEVLARMAATDQPVAMALVAGVAATVAAAAPLATPTLRARLLLLLALAGLLPPVIAGHASTSPDHDVATTALIVHVLAAALWVGGLAGILVHLRGDPRALAEAVPRFSVLALAAFLALGGSGVIAATTQLGTTAQTWASGYGALVVAKAAALLALGALGVWHRRATLPALLAGRSAGFWRLAGVEVLVMGAAIGLATALARTPVPAQPVAEEPSHGLGHATLPEVVERISPSELVTAWRPNAIVLVVVGVTLAAYVAGVRTHRGRGGSWPVARTSAFVAGLLLALLALVSGVATYAPAMVSVQVAQLLVVLVPVPVLLALGAPVTLWLHGRGEGATWLAGRAGRILTDPVVGASAVCGLLIAVYRTPVIEWSLRSPWAHLLMLGLALAAGLLLWWPVLGVDPVPAPRARPERGLCVAAVAGCLALLAAQLRYGDRLLAATWFLELRWGWVDPVEDQRLAGLVFGAVALGVLLLAATLRRESARVSTYPDRPVRSPVQQHPAQ